MGSWTPGPTVGDLAAAISNAIAAAPYFVAAELREPTPEECNRIENQFTVMNMRLETSHGRDMFDAVRAVMWPK